MQLNSSDLTRGIGSMRSPCLDCTPNNAFQSTNLLDHSTLEHYDNGRGASFESVSSNASARECIQCYLNEQSDVGLVAPPFIFYIVGVIMTFVFVLGFSENAMVLYVYIQNRKLRTVSNVFIAGLSISDIGQAIFNLPLVVISNFCRGWIFGHDVCMYYGFVTTTFGLSQISLLTVIAMERYCIIVHHSRVFSSSMTKAVVAIGSCFLYGLAWALGPLFGWSEYQVEKFGTRCAVSWEIKNLTYLSYTLCLFTFVWFIPLLLITFGYTSIACMIYREKSLKPAIRSSSETKSPKEQKVAITVLIMIGAFIISWLPYSAVALYTAIGGTANLSFATTLVPALVAKSSIIWNPIIYVVRHRDFRKACVKTLKMYLFCYSTHNGDSSVKTDYTHKYRHDVNVETARRLLKQSSMSVSEDSSTPDSCVGTRVSGLVFDSFEKSGPLSPKIPRLTSKQGWMNSPHPKVRKSFYEPKRVYIPSIEPDYAQSNRNKEMISTAVTRKNFLKTASASKTLSTVVDIECEAGACSGVNTNGDGCSSTGYGQDGNETILNDAIRYALAYPLNLNEHQTRTQMLRRHQSLGTNITESKEMVALLKNARPHASPKRIRTPPTMFESTRDEVRNSRNKSKVKGQRRHKSDSSTQDKRHLRYSKCDAKQRRCLMRTAAREKHVIEMSVFEKESSNVFTFDEADVRRKELSDIRQTFNEENTEDETFGIHIGACAMIRQSTV